MLSKETISKVLETTKQILKKAKYKIKDFKISVKNYRYSATASIVILNPKINRKEVKCLLETSELFKAIAKVYFEVNYAYGAFDEVSKRYNSVAQSIIENKKEVVNGFDGLYFCHNKKTPEIWQEKTNSIQKTNNVHRHIVFKYFNTLELAIFLYKFKNFGDIAA